MATNFVPIASTILTNSTTGAVTFNSFTATSSSLLLRVSARTTGSTTVAQLTVNGTGASYTYGYCSFSNAGNAVTQSFVPVYLPVNASNSSSFSVTDILFINYSSQNGTSNLNTKKQITVQSAFADAGGTTADGYTNIYLVSAVTTILDAITSITLTAGNLFASGSRFDLYTIN